MDILKNLHYIEDEPNLEGKYVLLRANLNVPFSGGEIEDDFRLKKALPTIEFLSSKGARTIIIGHIWGDEEMSLHGVHEYLQNTLPLDFVPDILDDSAKEKVSNMNNGDVVLFENLRLFNGEIENDISFAERLATFGDIYVNDDFSVSHREHASVVLLPKLLPSFIGIQFKDEIENLSIAFNPPHPFLFVLGGAKFETKLPLIKEFIEEADDVFVGGALANVFIQKQGHEVGLSLLPASDYNIEPLLEKEKLHVPQDVISRRGIEKIPTKTADLQKEDDARDIGPEALETLKELAQKAAFVLWNGPLGDYEVGFEETTEEFAKTLADIPGKTVIGGGDTFAVISKLHIEDSFDFISTAGGAMLEFLAMQTLPGIEALKWED